MRTVFHIGTNKTGSTTLQNSLAGSREYLLGQGILYPRLSNYGHHTQLLFAVIEEDEFPMIFGRNGIDGVQRSQSVSQDMWDDLTQQVTTAVPHTLVLSSEYAFGMRPQSIKKLVKRLRNFSEEICLFGYFRSPTSHYLSGQQQTLKFGHNIKDPRQPFRYKSRYNKIKRSGADECVVRLFHRDELYKACIVKDFMKSATSLSVEGAQTIDVSDDNESISSSAMEVLYHFNCYAFPKARVPGNPLSKLLIQAISEAEDSGLGYVKPQLRSNVTKAILSHVSKELQWLSDKLGLTFPDIDKELLKTASDVAFESKYGQYPTKIKLTPADICDIDTDHAWRLQIAVLDLLLSRHPSVRQGQLLPNNQTAKGNPLISGLLDVVLPGSPSNRTDKIRSKRRLLAKILLKWPGASSGPQRLDRQTTLNALNFVILTLLRQQRQRASASPPSS